jgi:pyruvate dehydrogenase E2 component (dihydrolipoamide acetyltransferase)
MVHNIIMPDLGQTVSEGKIVRWLKAPGDKVARGEQLLEVETDKVTMEVESYQAGYLRKLLVGEGQMAQALSPIAILTDYPEESCDPSRPAETVSAAPPQHEPPADFQRAPNPQSGSLTAAPSAKALARELSIDLSAVTGTGPGGLINRKDVEQFAAARAAKPGK